MNAKNQLKSSLICVFFLLSSALAPIVNAASVRDITPPSIQHEPDSNKASANSPYLFTAKVEDDNGVSKVLVFYRTVGTSVFSNAEMKEGKTANLYMVELPGKELRAPGIEYYIQAEDTAGNTLLRGFTFEPLVLTVENTGSSIPGNANASKEKGPLTGLASNKMVWIGLGALVIGAVAMGGSSGGDGDDGNTVTIAAPLPQ